MKTDQPNQTVRGWERSQPPNGPLSETGTEVTPSLPEDRLAALRGLFRSERFNRTDGLDDYAGDFRSFHDLGSIVTADMRHQMERQCQSAPEPASVRENTGRRLKARRDERHRPPPMDPADESVTLVSEGRTLIIGGDEERVTGCGRRLSRSLPCVLVVAPSALPEATRRHVGGLPLFRAEGVRVQGYLGRFTALLTVGSREIDLADLVDGDKPRFDLVLDLRPGSPVAEGRRLPFGYYAPGDDPVELVRALRELPGKTGTFEKPQFIRYSQGLCLHRRSGRIGCRLCVDACPCGAIQETGDGIEIDHCLCQGCGVCEAVCPTGAVCLQHPSLEDLLSSLWKDLSDRRQQDERATMLVIHEEQSHAPRFLQQAAEWPGQVLCFEVEDIGCLGVEVLLAAVAYGAFRVVVSLPPAISSARMEWVHRQARMAETVLAGLGQPAGRVQVVDDATTLEPAVAPEPASPAEFERFQDKRMLLRLAVQHLFEQNPQSLPWISLPVGASYGEVRVSGKACTHCMACAAVCPTEALSAGEGHPCLRFVEARCVQCGLCAQACPEQAIVLHPRLVFELETTESARVLVEEEPLHCMRCGAPFASRSMIERMTAKLAGHWMYRRPQDLQRLQMCGTCRVRDLFQTPGDGS